MTRGFVKPKVLLPNVTSVFFSYLSLVSVDIELQPVPAELEHSSILVVFLTDFKSMRRKPFRFDVHADVLELHIAVASHIGTFVAILNSVLGVELDEGDGEPVASLHFK